MLGAAGKTVGQIPDWLLRTDTELYMWRMHDLDKALQDYVGMGPSGWYLR